MIKLILGFLSLLFANSAVAQGGCSDAGVCTLGGHSTEASGPSAKLSVRLLQTLSANSDYAYFESTPALLYEDDPIRVDLSVNWRYSQSLVIETAVDGSLMIESRGKSPRIQHVRPHAGRANSTYAFGDAKLGVTIPVAMVAAGSKLHLAATLPMTKLYADREQDLQSTLGVPTVIAGLSYGNEIGDWTYGSTLAYQTSFGQQNELHLTRADDLALALRALRPWGWLHSIGFDMSAIYHLADDRLHGIPTREVSGYQRTSGLTVNFGASAVKTLGDHALLSLFVAAPITGIAHVDGLKRSFVIGLALSSR